jgi:hypothetical protein
MREGKKAATVVDPWRQVVPNLAVRGKLPMYGQKGWTPCPRRLDQSPDRGMVKLYSAVGGNVIAFNAASPGVEIGGAVGTAQQHREFDGGDHLPLGASFFFDSEIARISRVRAALDRPAASRAPSIRSRSIAFPMSMQTVLAIDL